MWRCASLFVGAAFAVGAMAPAHAGSVVVNEVQTAGPSSAADEFVEIVNVSANPIDLNGWKLVYRSAAGTADTVLVRFSQGAAIPAGGVLVYGGSAYAGAKDGALSGALASSGGGVAIRDAEGARVDSVAYGDSTANAFVEGHPAVAPPAGHSIHRIPCGSDTDENRADFQDLFPPTPKAPCNGGGPIVEGVTFTPPNVDPGKSSTLSATVSANGSPITAVRADLTTLGGAAVVSLTNSAGTVWTGAASVAAGVSPGSKTVAVTAVDAAGRAGSGAGVLKVNNPVPGSVVINEIQTAGATANTEFVELYNRTSAEIDLAGYRLVYRSAAGTTDTTLCTFGPVSIRAGRTYLVATADYSGPKDAGMTAGLAGGGGSVALKDAGGTVRDAVGWGAVDNDYVEISPALAPAAGQSIERTPDGQDTNVNAADFRLRASPTPVPGAVQPVVAGVAFSPAAVDPGGSTTLTATVTPGGSAVVSVVADLTAVGLAYEEPLTRGAGGAWMRTLSVSALTTPGAKNVLVTAADADGLEASRAGVLSVNAPPPPPVKVNEVKTGGGASAADEFVEVYNPSLEDANLNGWSLVYRAAASSAETALVSFGAATLKAGGYLVFGGTAFAGAKDGALAGSLTSEGGAVGLRDPYGRVVDSVGYGTATNALVEGKPAAAPAVGQSIERNPAGHDSGDNSADFRVCAQPTPMPLTACPWVSGVTFAPNPAAAGGAATVSALASPGSADIAAVEADLSSLGLSSAVPMAKAGALWSASFTAPAGAATGSHTASVKATDAAGHWACAWGVLSIANGTAKGDANGDGRIDAADAVLALQLAGGLASRGGADVSGDGRASVEDALRILRAARNGSPL
ncbi:MAG TPA: lamin tail domain-containing protein [Armatimonadota bacterium]|jgi:hypothetical protein